MNLYKDYHDLFIYSFEQDFQSDYYNSDNLLLLKGNPQSDILLLCYPVSISLLETGKPRNLAPEVFHCQ